MFPVVRDFTYLIPFEDQIWRWAGLEQLECPQNPVPTLRRILLHGKHTCEWLSHFAHRDSPCDLMLRGQCPLGTLVLSHPTWPSTSRALAFPGPKFRQASPSQGKSLRHIVPSLGSTILALLKNISPSSCFQPVFCALHSSDFRKVFFWEGRVGVMAGPSFLTAGESEAACQMVNLNRGSCCHGDAKLHPVAVATKVKKLMLRQENHMMWSFFV